MAAPRRRAGGRPASQRACAVLPARTAADHYARALVGPWLSGADTSAVDAADFVSAQEGEDWLVRGGYGHLVERFGAGLPVRPHCSVTAVHTRADGVEAHTSHGRLRAGRAIVTVPLGVWPRAD